MQNGVLCSDRWVDMPGRGKLATVLLHGGGKAVGERVQGRPLTARQWAGNDVTYFLRVLGSSWGFPQPAAGRRLQQTPRLAGEDFSVLGSRPYFGITSPAATSF